jgi:hypothetical protein
MPSPSLSSTNNSLYHVNDDRKYLILGCGHGFFCGCDMMHPKKLFATIDIHPRMNPDYILDFNDQNAVSKVFKNKKFAYIICEYIHPELPLTMQDYLEDDGGCTVFIGNNVLEKLIKALNIGTKLYYLQGVSDHVIIVPKSFHAEVKLDSVINKYLLSNFWIREIEPPVEIVINDQMKAKVNNLVFKYIPRFDISFCRDSTDNNLCTSQDVKSYCKDYKPGFFRRHFSAGGKTTGMRELETYVDEVKDEKDSLSIANMFDILQWMNIYEINRSFGSLMYAIYGNKLATSQVFRKITFKILNSIISEMENVEFKNEVEKEIDHRFPENEYTSAEFSLRNRSVLADMR